MTLKISSRAFWNWNFSICSSYRARRPVTREIRLSSSAGSACRASGSFPPKYFSAMAVVRLTRLPKSLARSVLMV